MNHWVLIFIAAGSNVALNLLLKKAGQGLDASSPKALVLSALGSGWIWLAVLSGVILLAAFITAIRSYSLSLTYTAITAMAMVALTFIDSFVLRETLGNLRLIGLGLIVIGLVLSSIGTTA